MPEYSENENPINPYAAPVTDPGRDPFANAMPGEVLAGRLHRLGAVMIDGIVMMFIIVPIQIASGFLERTMTQEVGIAEQLGMSLVGVVAYLIPNGYFLVTRGQSLGKMVLGIQIVDADTNELLPFLRVYVFRYMWMTPIVVLVILIPGPMDDSLIQIASVIDALFIFRSDKRCLHDLIAGSKVVNYKLR